MEGGLICVVSETDDLEDVVAVDIVAAVEPVVVASAVDFNIFNL